MRGLSEEHTAKPLPHHNRDKLSTISWPRNEYLDFLASFLSVLSVLSSRVQFNLLNYLISSDRWPHVNESWRRCMDTDESHGLACHIFWNRAIHRCSWLRFFSAFLSGKSECVFRKTDTWIMRHGPLLLIISMTYHFSILQVKIILMS